MAKKSITAENFVKGVENNVTDNLKEKYFNDTVEIKGYIGINEKLGIAERIASSTMFIKDENGKERLRVNSVSRFILLRCIIVDTYTNIKIDFSNVTGEYDLLSKNGLIDIIIGCIPENEIGELNMIVDMMIGDIMTNKYEPAAYIEEQIDKFSFIIDKFMTPLVNNVLSKLNSVSKKDIDGFIKKFEKIKNNVVDKKR